MLARSRPVVIDRYGSRRTRRRVPRWLVLLATGIVLGAVGVLIVQERYLPPRLSAQASAALRADYEQADAERRKLRTDLAGATGQLDAALGDTKRLTGELQASRAAAERLREQATALAASLPPDPRGGAVEVRAARFTVDAGALVYDLVLTRERAGKPLAGVLQLVVSGAGAGETEAQATLEPVPITVGPVESLRGSVPLPQGFRPRETTVRVLDGPGGRVLGRRVMRVK